MSARRYAVRGGGGGRPGRGPKGVSYLMLTAMIWRMESRTVVAAMVGGNCSMERDIGRYLDRGVHPAQRIVARVASDGPQGHEKHYGYIGRQGTVLFMSFRASKLDFRRFKGQRLLPGEGKVQQTFSVTFNDLLSALWPH